MGISAACGVALLLASAAAYAGGTVDKSGVRPQVIKLPDGPGSITGLGESFEPQLNSGTGSYRVPLTVPPGRAGHEPDLALAYNGGRGNSAFGLGWTLSLGRVDSIQRQTDKGLPVYNDATDAFITNEGEELVKVDDSYYRAESEAAFNRFEMLVDGPDECDGGWKAWHRDGVRSFFGCTPSSRIQRDNLTFKWLLARRVDANGNEIFYNYNEPEGFQDGPPGPDDVPYLTSIVYNRSSTSGATMRVDFRYEGRTDKLHDYRSRFGHRLSQRCVEVIMSAAGVRARSYVFGYEDTDTSCCLVSVSQYGRDPAQGPLPSILRFSYSAFVLNKQVTAMDRGFSPDPGLTNEDVDIVDMNGDGLPDILFTGTLGHEVTYNINGEGWSTTQGVIGGSTSARLYETDTLLLDMDGDGYSDLLESSTLINGYEYYRGGQADNGWPDTPVRMMNSAIIPVVGGTVQTGDLDSDGRIDVFRKSDGASAVSCWLNQLGLSFHRYDIRFPASPNDFDFGSGPNPSARVADMNGDGLGDIVAVYAAGFIRYYPSRGITVEAAGDLLPVEWQGWDSTARGPWDPDDPGRQGTLMENAPDGFDNPSLENVENFRSMILLDANGDGLSDLAYVKDNSLYIWLNIAGAGFSRDPYVITASDQVIPTMSAETRLRAADMNGNGTVDLVWNRQGGFSEIGEANASWVYLDLTDGVKPNLLTGIDNGIGKTIEIEYKSATELRSAAEEAGEPWTGKLPIAVNVVTRVTTGDGLGNFYVTENDYRDGYYDGVEKEFRGFAGATQTEVGDDSQGAPTLVDEYRFFTGGETPEQLTEIGLEPEDIRVESLKGRNWLMAAKDISGAVFHETRNTWNTRDLFVVSPPPADPWRAKAVTFTFMTAELKSIQEKLGPENAVEILKEMEYDDFGNMTRLFEHGRLDGDWDDERITTTTYTAQSDSGQEHWILDKESERVVTDELGTLAQQTRNYYDDKGLLEVDQGNLTLTDRWVAGEKWVAAARNGYDEYGNIVVIRDALYGVEPGHETEVVYDDTFFAFPITEFQNTGQDQLEVSATYDSAFGAVLSFVEPNGFQTTFGYDNFGRLTSITKPPDISPTLQFEYILNFPSPFGVLNWIETRKRQSTAGGTVDSRTYVDGLQRTLMTRSEGEDPGQVVVSEATSFNGRGETLRMFLPYFEEAASLTYSPTPVSAGAMRSEYDALLRKVKAIHPDGSFETMEYRPLEETRRDAEQTDPASPHFGCGFEYVRDGLGSGEDAGRLRQVVELVRMDAEGNPSDLQRWATTYAYDVLGNHLGHVDADGNTRACAFDGLSRRVRIEDPDRGLYLIEYDDAGNVRRSIDAKNQSVRYTYDGLNRILSERYGEETVSPRVEYHYDASAGPIAMGPYWGVGLETQEALDAILGSTEAPANLDANEDNKIDVADVVAAARAVGATVQPVRTARNTRGRLAWVRDETGEEHLSYDERGRTEWAIKRLISGSGGELLNFFSGAEYDSLDRVVRRTHADGTQLAQTYNSRGLLETMANVVDAIDYTPEGNKRSVSFANGVARLYEYDVRRRMIRSRAARQSDGATLDDVSYVWDNTTNLLGTVDGRSPSDFSLLASELGITAEEAQDFDDTQTFTYDNLYRLTAAAGSDTYGSINLAYDRIGNLISRTASLAVPDPIMNIGALRYGDGAGPHAVTSAGEPGSQAFSYDANGSLLSDGVLSLSWDGKNRIAQVTAPQNVETYSYDYRDTRRRKSVTGANPTVALYVNDDTELRDGELRIYAQLDSSRIAAAHAGGAGPKSQNAFTPDCWYLLNHTDSTIASLNASGARLESLTYFPNGRVRKRASTNSDGCAAPYTFTGKERDEITGFYYMSARYYSERTSAFLSVDPLFSELPEPWLEVPQMLNLYAYGLNNPKKYADPTGKVPVLLALAYVAVAKGIAAGVASTGFSIAAVSSGNVSRAEFDSGQDLISGSGSLTGQATMLGAAASGSNPDDVVKYGALGSAVEGVLTTPDGLVDAMKSGSTIETIGTLGFGLVNKLDTVFGAADILSNESEASTKANGALEGSALQREFDAVKTGDYSALSSRVEGLDSLGPLSSDASAPMNKDISRDQDM